MLVGGFEAKQRYGPDYMIAGKDGVHPGWAGHLVMAYAFLKAMGLDGQIGTITVDLADGKATASEGHRILTTQAGRIEIESSRYPFCATGPANEDSSIRSGMTLVPFNRELNRFLLVVRHAPSGRYARHLGRDLEDLHGRGTGQGRQPGGGLRDQSRSATPSNAWMRRSRRNRRYETRQIKDLFHGPEGHADLTMTAALTEKARTPLADAIKAAFVPVRHTITIKAER